MAVAFKDIALLSSTSRDGHASPRIDPSALIPRRADREKKRPSATENLLVPPRIGGNTETRLVSFPPLHPVLSFFPLHAFLGTVRDRSSVRFALRGILVIRSSTRGAYRSLFLFLSRSRARGNLCGGNVSDVQSSRLENVGRLVDARPTSSLPPRLIVGDRDATRRGTRVIARHRAPYRALSRPRVRFCECLKR